MDNVTAVDFCDRAGAPTADQFPPDRRLDLWAGAKLGHVTGDKFLGDGGKGIGPPVRIGMPLSLFLFFRVNSPLDVSKRLQGALAGLGEGHDWILADHAADNLAAQPTHDDES